LPRAEELLELPDEASWDLDAEDAGDGVAPRVDRELTSILAPPLLPLDPDGEDSHLDLDPGDPTPAGTLALVVSVRLAEGVRDFDAGEFSIGKADLVVVETERGLTIGTVAHPPMRRMTKETLHRVLRKVDQTDSKQTERNQARQVQAHRVCKTNIRDRKLPMKLIQVEYLHNTNKAVFYFTAENRIDFRDLVKDLAQQLHSRVEMRQVGVRDGAKMSGGIGSCGYTLCCSTWLRDFDPVSIRMAKTQNLVLNPTKVSGQCGRLKCCLAYEQNLYQAARRQLPKIGRWVTTPNGDGRVEELDIPRLLVSVKYENGNVATYPNNLIQTSSASDQLGDEAQD
jgi:cell fate regulator YaaT (PSP1 superfamily)